MTAPSDRPFRDPPSRAATTDLFTTWWGMNEAHLECAGQPPIDDGQVILHFSGSGASCMVFAKDIRLVCGVLEAAKELAPELRDAGYSYYADRLEGKKS